MGLYPQSFLKSGKTICKRTYLSDLYRLIARVQWQCSEDSNCANCASLSDLPLQHGHNKFKQLRINQQTTINAISKTGIRRGYPANLRRLRDSSRARENPLLQLQYPWRMAPC